MRGTRSTMDRGLLHPTAEPGTWAIYDGPRPYLDMGFQNADGAETLREDLLRHYPRGHEWRRRLMVRRVEEVAR